MTQAPTVQEMYSLFKDGVIGTKEFRSWLANNDPEFNKVRDPDVDNEIDANARERRRQQEEMAANLAANPELSLMDKEGNVRQISGD